MAHDDAFVSAGIRSRRGENRAAIWCASWSVRRTSRPAHGGVLDCDLAFPAFVPTVLDEGGKFGELYRHVRFGLIARLAHRTRVEVSA